MRKSAATYSVVSPPRRQQRKRHHGADSKLSPPSCLLCYSMEMTMLDLFSPPGISECDASSIISDTYRDNSESKNDDDDDDDDGDCEYDEYDYYYYDASDDNSISSSGSGSSESSDERDVNTSQDSSVARKICQLWKKKRKQVKAKTLRIRQEAHIARPKELTKRTNTAKSQPKRVARHAAKPVAPYDELDELHQSLVGRFEAVKLPTPKGRERGI